MNTRLIDTILEIGYSSELGIWVPETAETLTPDTPAQIGARNARPDGMKFLADGAYIGDKLANMMRERKEDMGDEFEQLSAAELTSYAEMDAEWLIEHCLNEML